MSSFDCLTNLRGDRLRGVRELVYVAADGSSVPTREGVALDFDSHSVTITTTVESSEIRLEKGGFRGESPDHTIHDATNDHVLFPCIGERLLDWWSATNSQGYTDGLMVAFGPALGVMFVAINNEVSILAVSGGQLA